MLTYLNILSSVSGVQYTLDTGNTLLEGYRQKGSSTLVIPCFKRFATVINTAAVGLLTAAILTFITPIPLPMPVLSPLVILVTIRHFIVG